MLVYTSVPNWSKFDIPESIMTDKQLEQFMIETAKANGVNVDELFPFVLEGTPQSQSGVFSKA